MKKQAVIAILIGFVLAAGIPGAVPARAVDGCMYLNRHCISGRIREFWEQNGGLPVFGLPIGEEATETVENQSYRVQWFERFRLELHPEKSPPYDVLLGRMGAEYLDKVQHRD